MEVVIAAGLERPPAGVPLRVEVRDTSLEDTEAPLVAENWARVARAQSTWLQTVELEFPEAGLDPRTRLSVFVHVDVDSDGRMSKGDFITTQSYPVPHHRDRESHIRVSVTQI